MSHSACKPIQDSVLGQTLDSIEDIARINQLVHENSLDLLQTDHTLSGIDMAMWDLLGRKMDLPVYQLLGYQRAYPKTPYASQLFGDTPQATLEKARHVKKLGYRAVKFGWGPFGKGTVEADTEQLLAAREGLGEDAAEAEDDQSEADEGGPAGGEGAPPRRPGDRRRAADRVRPATGR